MDISFSNVLEGARQYFQGLPSPASNSSQPVPPPAGSEPPPQPQPPVSGNPARYENVASATPATTSGPQSSPTVLSYWPPPSSASSYQRKEVAATTMPQAHVGTPPAASHHVKTPAPVFNGSRPSTAEMNQTNYTPPPPPPSLRPQGHNLPPIAALSNYHSSRSSRDSLTTPRVQPQASHASSKGFHRPQQSEYTLPRQNQAQYVGAASGPTTRPQYGNQGPKYQQLGVVPSSVPTPTVSTSYHSFPSTPASASMSSTSSSSSSSVNPVSSHPQPPQFAYHPLPEQPSKSTSRQSQYPTQQLPYFNTSPALSTPSQQPPMVNGHQKPAGATSARPVTSRAKRESPLDLSVKTVRQSADSTAVDDSEGSFAARNYSPAPVPSSKNRPQLPPLQLPSSVAYPTMDSRGATRTPSTSSNSTSKSIGAPKIDFHANFAAHQHSSAPLPYGQESLQRTAERTHQQHYPLQHSSTPLPHVGSFKNLAQSGSFEHKQPPSAPFNHTPAQPSPYDLKQTPPAAYSHKLVQSTAAYNHKHAQSALYDSKYVQFSSYNQKPAPPTPYNQKQSAPTSYDQNKQPTPAPFEHAKQTQPQTLYDHNKQTQSSPYEHSKHTPPALYDHSKQTQPTPYDHSKQTQPTPYDHSKQTQPTPYDHSKQTQPTPYDHTKQTQPTPYDHSKQTQPTPYDHTKQTQPTPYDHSKQTQPTPYDHSKQTQPTPYDHSKQTQPTPYDHTKPTQPAPYEQTKPTQPTPYEQTKPTQPTPYEHTKPTQPTPYDHTKPTQPTPYEHTKPTQPTPYDHTKPTQPIPYDHTKQPQPTAYDHGKQAQPTSYDPSKQTQALTYEQSKLTLSSTYNHSKQSQNAAFDHGKQAQLPSFDQTKQLHQPPYNHIKPTHPAPYDHKQTPPISYDFKKLQAAKYEHKQTQPGSYDHSKQSQLSHYSLKHVQPISFEFKQGQTPSYDHNNQPLPATNYEYKQPFDHKQPQYYPTASRPQLLQPSKPSSGIQAYTNSQYSVPLPVPAGFDPTKRGVEGTPAHTGGRVDYRQVPPSAAYPNHGVHKRLLGEARHPSPAKVPRHDTWRQTIDLQIEQRLSSYASSRQQQQQQQQSVNGNSESNGSTAAQDVTYLQRHQPQQRINPQQPGFNSTAPAPVSQYPNRGPNLQKMLSSLPPPKSGRVAMPGGGAADKRVLNILRNTLEEKEARMTLLQNQLQHNAQLQQQYQQRQPHPPEAPVQLMLQQKPSLSPTLPPGRLNLPPFGSGLEDAHTSQHKLHVPRAVDSVRLDQDTGGQRGVHKTQTMMTDISRGGTQQGAAGTELMDGLAAYLAARIRTKAELKQVGPGMESLNAFRCPTPSSSVISVSNSSAQSARTTPGTPTVFSPPLATEDKLGEVSKSMNTPSSQANAGGGTSSSSGSPPKLTRERGLVVPPRRRLFSRPDEEQGGVGVAGIPTGGPMGPFLPPRDLSGLRSSSETSVFDFRDSDSEGEMPVLERQTLNEMRKDRRFHPKQPSQALTSVEGPLENSELQESADPFWSDTCDKFLEELRVGRSVDGKKRRGRQKKIDVEEKGTKSEKDVISEEKGKLENSVKGEEKVSYETVIKKEIKEEDTDVLKNENIQVECSSNESKKRKVLDSKDVPLRKRRARLKSEEDDVDDEISLAEIKARLGKRRDSVSESASSESELSDESEEKVETVAERLRRRKRQHDEEDSKKGMCLRSKDSLSPRKTSDSPSKSGAKKKKPHFGDGSDFTPGWEEQVYRFKRSLRMPARLINISRPPDASRLCASLPDLDPCPNSPAASTIDSSDFQQKRNTLASNLLRRWDAESDVESNSNLSMPCESEEATSSSVVSNKLKDKKYKIKEKNNSLLNLLVQKYGRTKSPRKKIGDNKWLERPGSRILPRKTAPELLPTPSLGIGSPKRGPHKKGKTALKKKSGEDLKSDPFSEIKDSVYLGYFRRKTVTNFRDAFLQNGSSLGSTFAPIVFKSRTRTQTRVMRQRATIREVFGEDRPASCPPTCQEESSAIGDDTGEGGRRNSNSSQGRANQTGARSAAVVRSNKAVLNSKRHLLQGGRRRNHNLIRALTNKTLQELTSDEDPKDKSFKLVNLMPKISSVKVPAAGLDAETKLVKAAPLVKRIKLRTVRRKFRSGFDYIRKKKKQQKKEDGDLPKIKKKPAIVRPSSESVQDIQNEIRGWVINKGLGETLLHRAARLGYTDVAAYCLETLDNPASPRDNAGYTPLHEACSRGHLDIARLLLMYGANVSDSAQGGIRPLHEAAESGYMEMMRLLLSYGADPLLATYGGQTPLSLATDEDARRLLQLHLADVQGLPAQPWNFQGLATCCDPVVRGYDVLQDPPCLSPEPVEDDEIEMELCEMALPVLYRLIGDPPTERWVLLQDLTTILRVKSKEALLRQLGPEPRSILKELKMADFLEQARCCHLMGSGEKINIRASKVALVPYNDKVREILGVEKVTVSSR